MQDGTGRHQLRKALRGAQEAGIAEPDPTLDVDGWDAANKLVIIANSVLRRPTRLQDLTVEGIRSLTLGQLAQARAIGRVVKLLALAEKNGDDYALSVRPTALPHEHILARTGLWEMRSFIILITWVSSALLSKRKGCADFGCGVARYD